MCIICQTTFSTGVLTVCGHEYCKLCITEWFKVHRTCPICKRHLSSSNVHDITIKPQKLELHTAEGSKDPPGHVDTPKSRKSGIYSEFNADKLAEIQNIELEGPSFTTKVDTLCRHLLWLRDSDPGAKSIVFSQYKDFLNVLRTAFQRFRIGHSSVDQPGGTQDFKEDPSIEVFLLHARAHSSGLNLVNASHVFLCEPLLNTALELQAIARVDRIGQKHETTVWLYIVSGTVEESIYNLSVQRRMKHVGRGLVGDEGIEEANTLELEQAALSKLMSRDRSFGESVDRNDLWDCLFGHIKRDEAEEADNRFQERAVMGYMAAEAAERREAESHTTA